MAHTRILPINSFKRLLFLVRVEGESLLPELLPGRYYLTTSLKKPKVGSYIVFPNPHNERQIFIKKIKSVKPEGYYVSGSVFWGTSSEDFGLISRKRVLGTVTFR